jgi:hypothetical protein
MGEYPLKMKFNKLLMVYKKNKLFMICKQHNWEVVRVLIYFCEPYSSAR